jgi:glycerophosphoryl diester phosphodiesterase
MRVPLWSDVQQRLPSQLDPPIMFGHRGARAHAPDNTLESFRLALRLGATGLESDVWLTSDGVPVLDHDGVIRRGRFRKVSIGQVVSGDLPAHIPTLAEMIAECGDDTHVSLDLKALDAAEAVIEVVARSAPAMLPRLWLCYWDLDALIGLRHLDDAVRLVDSTRLDKIAEGPERRAARLAHEGIDAINMRRPDWNGGLVALFHRFDRIAFSWDVQLDDQLRTAFRMGVDGVFSDYVERMVDAFRSEIGAP